MFRVAAFVPSPPVLIPELTGRGADEAATVRAAALVGAEYLAAVADRWLAVGVDDHSGHISSQSAGTFAGFGVDVPVSLSPRTHDPDSDPPPPDLPLPDLPLPALIAAWLRGRVAPAATVDVHLVGRDLSAARCAQVGRELRSVMDAQPETWGVLVIGDGATTLTSKAPGSFDDRAENVQRRIDDALATADVAALSALDRELCLEVGVSGLQAWQTLVGVVGDEHIDARTLYRGAPFGVGYFVGVWEPVPGVRVSGQ